jgi:hypothetical protein
LQQRLTEVNHPDHTLITYPEFRTSILSFIRMDNEYWTDPTVCSSRSLLMA